MWSCDPWKLSWEISSMAVQSSHLVEKKTGIVVHGLYSHEGLNSSFSEPSRRWSFVLIYVQFLLPLQNIRCVTKLSSFPAAILGLHSRSVLLERKQTTVKKTINKRLKRKSLIIFFANSTNRLFKNWFINTFTRSKKQCWIFQKLSNLDFIRSNQFK